MKRDTKTVVTLRINSIDVRKCKDGRHCNDHHRREAETHGSVKLVTKLADSRESKLI